MAAFAGYGFPKAHAAGYAALAYRLAYLKAPLSGGIFCGAPGRVGRVLFAARVHERSAAIGPDGETAAHQSQRRSVHARSDRSPDVVDGTGAGARVDTRRPQTRFIAQRPFTSLDDFLIRARPLHVEAINLIKASALEGLGDQRRDAGARAARTVAWPALAAVELDGLARRDCQYCALTPAARGVGA